MNFAQQVLHALQILAPAPVVVGKEIFDGIAEALDSNAQLVEIVCTARAHCGLVQTICVDPSLQREMLKNTASRRQLARALIEFMRQLHPSLGIEILETVACGALLLTFASGKRRRKTGAERIAFAGEKRYPPLHDLRIAQIAQSREQRFREGTELFPSGCGIDGAKPLSH
ncbi:MAG: hypothetical protein WCC59_12490 [Terriglobales bacterium]